MSWSDFLIDKLNLYSKSKKIIIDKYKFTEDELFIDLLNKKQIKHQIAENTEKLFSLISTNNNIFFLGDLKDIPEAFKNKYEIIMFDESICYSQFPMEILGNYNLKEIRKLIIYDLNNMKPNFVSVYDFDKFLKNAKKDYIKQENCILEDRIFKIIGNKQKIVSEDIFELAENYASLNFNLYQINQNLKQDLITVIDEVMENFVLSDEYKQSFYKEQTINKVLKKIKNKFPKKLALICFDGMGILEWQLLKFKMKQFGINICNEELIFSLLPSTTHISRSSLFSGKVEECYERKINEKIEFKNNFSNMQADEFKEGEIIEAEILDSEAVKIIYNVFDDLGHSQVFINTDKSKNNYYESVEKYFENSLILEEIKKIMTNDYKVFISSDHGNIVAKGNGIQIEKYLIESKCKRAVITPDTSLIDKYKNNALIIDIPFVNHQKLIVAKNREFFDRTKGNLEITHGGISIEEMVIPFAELGE